MEVSVITINYNNELGLKKTFDSVFSQSLEDFEYIVIDGGSTDGSAEIITHYSSKFTYWCSEPDRGIYNALNKGISKANGEYLLFLNSGDCFFDVNTIYNCLSIFKKNPSADIYYGDISVVNSKGKEDFLKKFPNKLDLDYFQSNTINHQASLIRADLFKEFGLYPERYKLASDYWLFLKSLLNNKVYMHLDFPMVTYDNSGLSATNYQGYKEEKEIIWESLVPECVLDLMKENKKYKQLHKQKIIKAAIKLNSNLKRLRF
ncbi:glycosyltransferase [Pontibacter diazotrophicus]|uniref:Glycosyltransferase n=1 Tax=Pontibacter diazotrophicus TaxID=1400979 RepID=A0A3D8LD55_9BACT|nr:glycosyltransferase family 2 protein [Pontibacter diazotrophicus]RDV14872.1 glycosyltransferase [Pontibacter diazotrophicus]